MPTDPTQTPPPSAPEPTAEDRLQTLEQQLAKAQSDLARAETRRAVERELAGANTVDIDTARLLTEAALGEKSGPGDIAKAVADLKKRKPFLFRPAAPWRTAAPAPSAAPAPALADLAREAQAAGDRPSLLRYLRARRAS